MTDLFDQEVEDWVKDVWLKERFGKQFKKMKVRMQDKGFLEFDAVDEEKEIVAMISTAETKKGMHGSEKRMRLRADCLMLSLANADIKLMILTDSSTYKLACREQDEGRLPQEIKLLHAHLPKKDAVRS